MKRPFAVFDIDGTLARWSLYISVVDHLIDNHMLTGEAYERTREMYNEWRRRSHEGSFAAYEIAIVEAWDQLQSEITYTDFMVAAKAVFRAQRDHNYIYTRKLIQDLKQQDYFLIALSGSHQEIIDQIAEYHGFDLGVGTTYFTKDDMFTGDAVVPGLDKGTALKQIVEEYNLDFNNSIAVGDTAGDIAMLELVSRPIAFNPEKTLRDKAIEEQWQIVIERKNCTYSLIPSNGGYRLEI